MGLRAWINDFDGFEFQGWHAVRLREQRVQECMTLDTYMEYITSDETMRMICVWLFFEHDNFLYFGHEMILCSLCVSLFCAFLVSMLQSDSLMNSLCKWSLEVDRINTLGRFEGPTTCTIERNLFSWISSVLVRVRQQMSLRSWLTPSSWEKASTKEELMVRSDSECQGASDEVFTRFRIPHPSQERFTIWILQLPHDPT